jgi:phosphatidylglycerol:prolipoprotein diacylglycerol transferase
MYPILFEVGGFKVTTFGLMLGLAFLAAGWIASKELPRKGYHKDLAWTLLMGALIGGILGAKLYYALLNWPDLVHAPLRTLFSRAGLVWYGGLVGGSIGVTYVLRRAQLPFWQVADLAALSIPAAYAIGRLGCFLVGDDYGRPTDSWVGLAFPEGSPPSTAGNLRLVFGVELPAEVDDSQLLRVHPTQLYETCISALIFIVLWRLRRRGFRPGFLFSCYLLLAGLERGFVEVFRVKDDRFFGPFTLAQLISLALVLAGAFGVAAFSRGDRARAAAGADR